MEMTILICLVLVELIYYAAAASADQVRGLVLAVHTRHIAVSKYSALRKYFW